MLIANKGLDLVRLMKKHNKLSQPSTKINALIKYIRDHQDDKMLIFLKYTKSFKVVSARLKQEDIAYLEYDGLMDTKCVLDAFKDEDKGNDVLLISLQSAAAGLNLQCANHVIFLGPSPNAAIDKQAIGRCWRSHFIDDIDSDSTLD